MCMCVCVNLLSRYIDDFLPLTQGWCTKPAREEGVAQNLTCSEHEDDA